MSEQHGDSARPGETSQDEATEAAQNVTDEVSSYQSGAPEETVDSELGEGLDRAGVEVSEEEQQRLTQEISDDEGTPEVDDADPRP